MEKINRFKLNPDYRKEPKTSHFCSNCQRDFKDGEKVYLAKMDNDFENYLPLDINQDGFAVFLGSECVKKLPKEYKDLV